MTLDAWSLAYAPGVSVFPARSGFTPRWVKAHTYCHVLFSLCVADCFTVLQVFTLRRLLHY